MDIQIGQKYSSNIENSSGRIYEVIDINLNQSTFTETIKLKDINSVMTATYSLYQIKSWVNEGRLKLLETKNIVKLHESWNQKWPERNSSGTYLEGHLCRR